MILSYRHELDISGWTTPIKKKKNGPQDPRVAITYEGLSEFGRSTSQSSFQAQQHHGNRISLFRGYRYMITLYSKVGAKGMLYYVIYV